MSHWTYRGKKLTEIPEDAHGFVYRITHKKSGKKYIGRKYFWIKRRRKVKGRKNRKVYIRESDWKTYSGSSSNLNEMIDEYGKDSFTYEILAIGYTKGQVNYLEENIQHKLDVLTDDDYLNDSVGSRRYIGVKSNDVFKQAISTIDI